MCVRTHILSNINICTQKVLFNVKKNNRNQLQIEKNVGVHIVF
jgi:hypothetical protein